MNLDARICLPNATHPIAATTAIETRIPIAKLLFFVATDFALCSEAVHGICTALPNRQQ